MRIAAAVVVPLLCLLAAELLLRLMGYGISPHLFLPTQVGGKPVLIDNDRFGWLFMPPALARSPHPIRFPARKAPGTRRIFVLGESAAMGDPEPAYGLSRTLQVLLEDRFPQTHFEVINTAMTAINSHVIRAAARDCGRYGGDIWVVYMGNNEVVGPFGPGTVFGRPSAHAAILRATTALKMTRSGQLLEALTRHLSSADSRRRHWGGMEMFLDQQIRRDDPRLTAVYAHFKDNLEDILRAGTRSGAKVLVSSVACNLKDCAPFGSLHQATLTPEAQSEWERLYAAGCADDTAGRGEAALAAWLKAEQIDPEYALLQYHLGGAYWRAGDYAEAKRRYENARNLDTLRFRADSRLNRITREVTEQREREGIFWVDLEQEIARQSPRGTIGDEYFFEHVHFNFAGNYLAARTLAERIAGLLTIPGAPATPPAWLSPEICAARLALTDWNRDRVVEQMRLRLTKAPFNSQLCARARDERLQQLRLPWHAATLPGALPGLKEAYRAALDRRPDDWELHHQYGRLLESFGAVDEAAREWGEVIREMPQYAVGHYQLGRLLNRGQDRSASVRHLTEALRRMPYFPEARNSLGIALSHQGQVEAACQQFSQALALRPDFAEARVNWGLTLAHYGRTNEAMTQFAAALDANTNYLPAHLEVAREFARRGDAEKAVAHFETVRRLDPHHPAALKYLENTRRSE